MNKEASLKKSKGKLFVGKVVSTKMKDTIIVLVDRFVLHPLYKKPIKRRKQFAVHAPNHAVKEGDIVTIKETRPISKKKHFMLVSIRS